MTRRILGALALVSLATAAAIAASKFKPTGATANNRYNGYFEAIEVLYTSTELTNAEKLAAVTVLLESPKVDQYFVEVSTP